MDNFIMELHSVAKKLETEINRQHEIITTLEEQNLAFNALITKLQSENSALREQLRVLRPIELKGNGVDSFLNAIELSEIEQNAIKARKRIRDWLKQGNEIKEDYEKQIPLIDPRNEISQQVMVGTGLGFVDWDLLPW